MKGLEEKRFVAKKISHLNIQNPVQPSTHYMFYSLSLVHSIAIWLELVHELYWVYRLILTFHSYLELIFSLVLIQMKMSILSNRKCLRDVFYLYESTKLLYTIENIWQTKEIIKITSIILLPLQRQIGVLSTWL